MYQKQATIFLNKYFRHQNHLYLYELVSHLKEKTFYDCFDVL